MNYLDQVAVSVDERIVLVRVVDGPELYIYFELGIIREEGRSLYIGSIQEICRIMLSIMLIMGYGINFI